MEKIDLKLDNWNDTINRCRANKYDANTHKQKEMRNIALFLRKMKKIEKYPVKINCYWHIKSSNSDLDNCSLKSVLDCMQKIGILENDNINHINEINYKAIKDKEDYLEIEVVDGCE